MNSEDDKCFMCLTSATKLNSCLNEQSGIKMAVEITIRQDSKSFSDNIKPYDKKTYMKEYYQRPEVKLREKEYNQRPESRLRRQLWRENHKDHEKAYRQRPEIKLRILENQRKWQENNREKTRKWTKEWQKKNPDKVNEWRKQHLEKGRENAREYAQNNPEIRYAEQLARQKVPLKPYCEICYGIKILQRAHFDYDKPLDVHTFCIKCHTMIDRIIVPNITDPKITYLLLGVKMINCDVHTNLSATASNGCLNESTINGFKPIYKVHRVEHE